jgi:hypothetical protein
MGRREVPANFRSKEALDAQAIAHRRNGAADKMPGQFGWHNLSGPAIASQTHRRTARFFNGNQPRKSKPDRQMRLFMICTVPTIRGNRNAAAG